MEQRDYLVRQLEMIGPMLMYMLGIWKDGRINEAIEYGAEAIKNILDISFEEIENLDTNLLLDFLINKHNFKLPQIRILAEILLKMAEIELSEDPAKGIDGLKKSKVLFEYFRAESQTYSIEVSHFIDTIEEMNNNLP